MLIEKIESCSIHAGVIGLGYVGLPLMVAMANAGFRVTGIDINTLKIERLKLGISDVPDVPDAILQQLIKVKQIDVTDDFNVLSTLDTINICVPTPLDENRTPDMQYIKSAVKEICTEFANRTVDHPRKHYLPWHNRRNRTTNAIV